MGVGSVVAVRGPRCGVVCPRAARRTGRNVRGRVVSSSASLSGRSPSPDEGEVRAIVATFPSSGPLPVGSGLVLGPVEEELAARPREARFNSKAVGTPVVRTYKSEEDAGQDIWVMYYTGEALACPAAGHGTRIGMAVSGDGVRWKHVDGPLDDASALGPSENWWQFDTSGVAVGDVKMISTARVKADGESGSGCYWLFYSGSADEGTGPDGRSTGVLTPPEERFMEARGKVDPGGVLGTHPCSSFGVNGHVVRPGVALSLDGVYWSRIEADHASGALFDVGEPGEWDALGAASPCVLPHASRDFRMYYHTWDAQEARFRIGVAQSPDALRWEKVGPVFGLEGGAGRAGRWDEGGCLNPYVMHLPGTKNKQFLMLYEGVDSSGERSIGCATSDDGRNWKRAGGDDGRVVRAGEQGSWDAAGVGAPYAVVHGPPSDPVLHVYYTGYEGEAGRPTGRTAVGLAASAPGAKTVQQWLDTLAKVDPEIASR